MAGGGGGGAGGLRGRSAGLNINTSTDCLVNHYERSKQHVFEDQRSRGNLPVLTCARQCGLSRWK